jgi:tetratricopeptide (TPR) repeat protein
VALDEGHVRLTSVTTSASIRGAAIAADDATRAAVRAYIPDFVLSRLDAGQTQWLAELRRVSVAFVRLEGIEYGSDDALERTQTAFGILQRALDHYDGAVRQFLVDDKGTVLIAVFGLPPRVHEDCAVRAVRWSLAALEELTRSGFDASVGVTTGRVFCGPIGNERRREYALVGDVVNMAARLMEVASSDVLCDLDTQEAARAQISFDRLPSFVVKGRASAVTVYRPLRSGRVEGRRRGMVGRTAERAALVRFCDQLRNGTGAAVIVEGEPGVGKSRLLSEVLGSATEGMTILRARADPVERSRPYHGWTPILMRLLELDRAETSADRRSLVIEALADAPNLARLAPLLSDVLPIDLPDTEITSQMVEKVRGDNTRDLLIDLISRAAGRGPLVIVIEDAHWLDSSSWELVAASRGRLGASLLILSLRLMPDPPHSQVELLAAGAHRMTLDTLSPRETLALVRQCLGVRDVAIDVAQHVHRASAGNPLFVEELTAALRDSERVVVTDGVCGFAAGVVAEGLDLPETVQGVMTTRIDQLSLSEQLTLKVASVIGPEFPAEMLREILPLEEARAHLLGELERLQRMDLLRIESRGGAPTYAFKHDITREVTYSLLTYDQRRQLHAVVADWYERHRLDDTGSVNALLAHHWAAAGDREKSRTYVQKAGEQALRAGAYSEAVHLLEEALQPAAGATSRWNRGRLERQLAEAYLGLGQHVSGHEHLKRALHVLGEPEPATVPALVPVVIRQIAVQAAHRLAPWSISRTTSEDSERILEAARAYIRLVEVHWFANRTPFLVHAGMRGLNLAERFGSSPELARAYAIMCIAAGSVPIHRLAEMYGARAIGTAQRVDQPHAIAYSHFITCVYAIGTGQWQRVEAGTSRAAGLFEEVGDRRLLGDARTVAAMSSLYQGRFNEAGTVFEAVRAEGQRNSNLQHQVWGLIGNAEVLLRGGRADDSVRSLEAVLSLLLAAPDRAEELRAQGLLAAIRERQGDHDRANVAAQRAATLIAELGAPTAHYLLEGYAGVTEIALARLEQDPRSRSLRENALRACGSLAKFARIFPIGRPRAALASGKAKWLSGNQRGARVLWRRGLVAAAALGMPYEEALARCELGLHAETSAESEDQLGRALQIFSRIGATEDLGRVQYVLDSSTSTILSNSA